MKGKKTYVWKIMASLLVLPMLTSCASIIGKGGSETLNIRSVPDQANIVITDESGVKIFEGKSPTSLPLVKSKGYFSGKKYTVNIQKDGFDKQSVTVDTRASGWYIGGNLLFGGLIGWLIVDPATGAMWTLDTNEVNMTLQASTQSSITNPTNAGIVLLDDVPLSLRNKMVMVSK